jgi:hypothetical protein
MLDFPAPSSPPIPPPVPLEMGLEHIRELGVESQARGELRVCGVVAAAAHFELGWMCVPGRYAGPDEPYVANYPGESVRHCWNVLPDGTIIDATANQFALDEAMPRVIPPDDHRQSWYLARIGNSHSDDYAIGWADNHPARTFYDQAHDKKEQRSR